MTRGTEALRVRGRRVLPSCGTTVEVHGFRAADATLLMSCFVGERSALDAGSQLSDVMREAVLCDVAWWMVRCDAVVRDPTNPARALEIITSDPRAVATLERLLAAHATTGHVVVREPGS